MLKIALILTSNDYLAQFRTKLPEWAYDDLPVEYKLDLVPSNFSRTPHLNILDCRHVRSRQ
jgi:hypothetical protein